jgi:hypothetical protein
MFELTYFQIELLAQFHSPLIFLRKCQQIPIHSLFHSLQFPQLILKPAIDNLHIMRICQQIVNMEQTVVHVANSLLVVFVVVEHLELD